MTDRVLIRRQTYRDSVKLMLVSRRASDRAGVVAAIVAMATPLNLQLAASQGFSLDGEDPRPDDLLIAIRAGDDETAAAAIADVEREMDEVAGTGSVGVARIGSLAHAARMDPALNLAFVSVRGRNAAIEVALALDAGLHVFCFSDGVPAEDEAALKARAASDGLLLMGPDCGTAIIDGAGLGFANAVARGPVGIVGASGTGIQELSCLLDAAGIGISQAVGVGGRDLALGGTMTMRALDLFGADDATRQVVIVTKPPSPDVLAAVDAHARELGKPVLFALPGSDDALGTGGTTSLEAAAARVATDFGTELPDFDIRLESGPGAGFVRGLFCGGTLALEATAILARALGRIHSNVPLRDEWALHDVARSEGHTVVDFGDDALTEGRAHPVIDPTFRLERLRHEVADPETAVLLLDVILGRGAHPDPASDLAPQLAAALAARDDLTVIVSLCGAEADPQGLGRQAAALRSAGVHVTRSAAAAARAAVVAVGTGEVARA